MSSEVCSKLNPILTNNKIMKNNTESDKNKNNNHSKKQNRPKTNRALSQLKETTIEAKHNLQNDIQIIKKESHQFTRWAMSQIKDKPEKSMEIFRDLINVQKEINDIIREGEEVEVNSPLDANIPLTEKQLAMHDQIRMIQSIRKKIPVVKYQIQNIMDNYDTPESNIDDRSEYDI
jgi:hypothetical protein